MRNATFVIPALLLCLACSSGRPKAPKPPPPPIRNATSLQEVLLQHSNGLCRLFETPAGQWRIEFHKAGVPRTFEVQQVGMDYVRLSEGKLVLDLPFASIAVILSDD